MRGEMYLDRCLKLADWEEDSRLPSLTPSVFPGPHCGLFAAMLSLKHMKDVAVLVMGTEECCFYARDFVSEGGKAVGYDDRFYSLVLSDDDLTFGTAEAVEDALKAIQAQEHYSVIFIVTTCVVELIGDDLDSICERLEEPLQVKLPVVHTEQINSPDHYRGFAAYLKSLMHLMHAPPSEVSENKVNLLGPRHHLYGASELCKVLAMEGVEVQCILPAEVNLKHLEDAANVKLNLVTHDYALPLAEAMEERFGVPMFKIYDSFAPDDLYAQLFAALELDITAHTRAYLQAQKEAYLASRKQLGRKMERVSYIYGNTPLAPLPLNRYLAELGMRPLLIQLSSIDHPSEVKALLDQGVDPYLCKNANVAPLQEVYPILKPQLYIGHEFARRLRAQGIHLMALDQLGNLNGYELLSSLHQMLEDAASEIAIIAQEMQGKEEKCG